MRISRHYIKGIPLNEESFTLDRDTSHYLVNVLRAKAKQQLKIFDGRGNEYLAEISLLDKKQTHLQLLKKLPANGESKLSLSLGIGLSKGDRMDWVIQKSTELGAQKITPLFTERTELKIKPERLEKKILHWQKIIISACEQCQRSTLPILDTPQPISQWIENQNAELKYVLHHRSEEKLQAGKTVRSIALLIGPEGGLSEEEIHHSEKMQFKPLSLGPRILRTETAPLAALAILQYLWGDMA